MEELFDIVYEGTEVKDCLLVRKMRDKKVLVYEPSGVYGGTVGLSQIRASSLKDVFLEINEAKWKRNVEKDVYIDRSLSVLRMNDFLAKELIAFGDSALLEFIPVKKTLLLEWDTKWRVKRIPSSREEMAFDKTLSPKEKFFLSRAMSMKTVDTSKIAEVISSLSEGSKRLLLEGVAGTSRATEDAVDAIKRFMEGFGDIQYLYPLQCMGEISEVVSRSNAVHGVAYIVSRDARVLGEAREFGEESELLSFAEGGGNKVEIETECGKAMGKVFVKMRREKKSRYVRVILSLDRWMEENAKTVYKLEGEYVHGLHLKVSGKEQSLHMIYLWSETRGHVDKVREKIPIPKCRIIAEAGFTGECCGKWYTTD
jgi:hypothetical protein